MRSICFSSTLKLVSKGRAVIFIHFPLRWLTTGDKRTSKATSSISDRSPYGAFSGGRPVHNHSSQTISTNECCWESRRWLARPLQRELGLPGSDLSSRLILSHSNRLLQPLLHMLTCFLPGTIEKCYNLNIRLACQLLSLSIAYATHHFNTLDFHLRAHMLSPLVASRWPAFCSPVLNSRR